MAVSMKFDWLLTFINYNDKWRRGRKLFHAHFNQGVITRYHHVQLDAARRFAREIIGAKKNKEALPSMIHTNFGQTIMRIVYGIDVKNKESPYISLPEKVMEAHNKAGVPGHFLVDFATFCETYRYARRFTLMIHPI